MARVPPDLSSTVDRHRGHRGYPPPAKGNGLCFGPAASAPWGGTPLALEEAALGLRAPRAAARPARLQPPPALPLPPPPPPGFPEAESPPGRAPAAVPERRTRQTILPHRVSHQAPPPPAEMAAGRRRGRREPARWPTARLVPPPPRRGRGADWCFPGDQPAARPGPGPGRCRRGGGSGSGPLPGGCPASAPPPPPGSSSAPLQRRGCSA